MLHDHVENFNAGVRTGDWSSMLERFEDAAELEFRGIPVYSLGDSENVLELTFNHDGRARTTWGRATVGHIAIGATTWTARLRN